jgi:hypothetical protein
VNLKITDRITPHLAQLKVGLSPARLNPRIGATAQQTFVNHFRALDVSNRNKIGGSPTHFYADGARQTFFTVLANGVQISCSKLGMMQRWKGGEITAGKTSQWLTIPNTSEAYGHTARDFSNLRFALFSPTLAALIAPATGATKATRTTKGGKKVNAEVKGTQNAVMFWLKKSVMQQANEGIVPLPGTITADISAMMVSYKARLARREALP